MADFKIPTDVLLEFIEPWSLDGERVMDEVLAWSDKGSWNSLFIRFCQAHGFVGQTAGNFAAHATHGNYLAPEDEQPLRAYIRDRWFPPVAYTIGHEVNYDRGIVDHGEKWEKLGRTPDYPGGYAFRSVSEALFEISCIGMRKEWAVYEMLAQWGSDTAPAAAGSYHNLLKDARITRKLAPAEPVLSLAVRQRFPRLARPDSRCCCRLCADVIEIWHPCCEWFQQDQNLTIRTHPECYEHAVSLGLLEHVWIHEPYPKFKWPNSPEAKNPPSKKR